jgi:hypothetical protein
MRFTEYTLRFVHLAARFEEETFGSTQISFPSAGFSPNSIAGPQLGSGLFFVDEATGARELAANASRIEGWRKTNTYQYCVAVCCHYFVIPRPHIIEMCVLPHIGFCPPSDDERDSWLRRSSPITATAHEQECTRCGGGTDHPHDCGECEIL